MQDQKKLSKNERASLIKKRRMKSIYVTDKPVEEIKTLSFTETLQKQYKINILNIKENNIGIEYVKVALLEAEEIWLNVQILLKTEQYAKMDDDQKVKLIQNDFKEFYKNFPIVSRYMICLGQYSMQAFKRMLIKCNETKKTDLARSSSSEEVKDYNEKLWIIRQTDYVRFLWEDLNSQDGTFDQLESDNIWNQTHISLTSEFQQFKDLHDSAEEKVKMDKIKHKRELLYEMSERLISGDQMLDNNVSKNLMIKLMDKLYIQRSKKVIELIGLGTKYAVKEKEVVTLGIGTNDIAKDEYDDELKQSFYKKNYKKMDINKFMS